MSLDVLDDTFYTPEQVADRLQLSQTTVYNLIKAGEIPAIRLGKSYRIPEDKLRLRLQPVQQRVPVVAQEFVTQLRRSELASSVREVLLFGSYARGEENDQSDIDILLVLDGLSAEQRTELYAIEESVEAAHDYRASLEVMKFTEIQWDAQRGAETNLAKSILRDGIALW